MGDGRGGVASMVAMRNQWWNTRAAFLTVVFLAVSGCAGTGGGAKVEGKVGVLDPARILSDTNAGKKAKDNLTAFSKNRQTLIELDEKELRRLEEDFVKQASVLSPAAKRDREEAFRRRMQEYQQKVTELNREVQEKQKDVMDGFREKIEAVAGKVAKRLGLQLVVDSSKGGVTLYREDTLDISNQVIEEFNRDYP